MITDFLYGLVIGPLSLIPSSLSLSLASIAETVAMANYYIPLAAIGICAAVWLVTALICAAISAILQLL